MLGGLAGGTAREAAGSRAQGPGGGEEEAIGATEGLVGSRRLPYIGHSAAAVQTQLSLKGEQDGQDEDRGRHDGLLGGKKDVRDVEMADSANQGRMKARSANLAEGKLQTGKGEISAGLRIPHQSSGSGNELGNALGRSPGLPPSGTQDAQPGQQDPLAAQARRPRADLSEDYISGQ